MKILMFVVLFFSFGAHAQSGSFVNDVDQLDLLERPDRQAKLACKMQAFVTARVKRQRDPDYPYSDQLESCDTDYQTVEYHVCVVRNIKKGKIVEYAEQHCALSMASRTN